MISQMKYVIQGIMLVGVIMIAFYVVKFIAGTKLSDASPTQIDIDVPQAVVISSSLKGQELFNQNCASCHALHKRLTGPALSDFEQRGSWKDRKQLYVWIHNPEAYLKHSKYARDLYKEYQVLMTPFPQLSNQDIDAIIEYIKSPVRMSY